MQQYIKKNYFCFLLVFQKIFIFLLFVIQVYLARVWTILIILLHDHTIVS